MSLWKYLLRTIYYYRRTHIPMMLGLALAIAVLSGALTVGTAVRTSLANLFGQRLGQIQYVLQDPAYVFSPHLAAKLQDQLRTPCAAILKLPATARSQSGQVNSIELLGVTDDFWSLAPTVPIALSDDEAAINPQLAERLGLRIGDFFTLRFRPLNPFSEKTLLQNNNTIISRRLCVAAVLTPAQFAGFNLQADQITPLSVFLSRSFLSRLLDLPDAATTILTASPVEPLEVEQIDFALGQSLSFDDMGLQWMADPQNKFLDLCSNRIFIPPVLIHAVRSVEPQTVGVLTYFVNEFSFGDAQTPYSFITAIGPLDPCQYVPSFLHIPAISDGQLITNRWLADDLGVQLHDSVKLSYWTFGQARELQTHHADLSVRAIIPMDDPLSTSTWTPNFPGLAEAESCTDWDPSIPINFDRIRPKDQDYWTAYRATPKSFINYQTGMKLFSADELSATLLRIPAGGDQRRRLEDAILGRLKPADFGLGFRDVRAQGRLAHQNAVDLGSLILSLSFFVIAAAVLLVVILISFSYQQRQKQFACMLALGFTQRQLVLLLLKEMVLLLIPASLLGFFIALVYAKIILYTIGQIWRHTASTANLALTVSFNAILLGVALTLVTVVILMVLMFRKTLRLPVSYFLSSASFGSYLPASFEASSMRRRMAAIVLFLIPALACFVWAFHQGPNRVASIMAAAFFLFLTGLAVVYYFLAKPSAVPLHSIDALAFSNIKRRPIRSLGVIALIALSFFLFVLVGAHYQTADSDQARVSLGHFQLYAQSAFPISHDLNDPCQASQLHLTDSLTAACRFTACRLYQGDDASCLNLNQAQLPSLLGVPIERFAGRFEFLKAFDNRAEISWDILNESPDPCTLPAAADYNTIVWALGKKLGDTLIYRDEKNQPVRIKLVASLKDSILQGKLIVSDRLLYHRFPHSAPPRVFLIESAPDADLAAIQGELETQLEHFGLTSQRSLDRLNQFRAVANLYIWLFETLSLFALLIGSVGLAVVLVRNCLERRQELAALSAMGFTASQLHQLVSREFLYVLFIAVSIGVLSGFIAVLPSWLTHSSIGGLGLIVIFSVIVLCFAWAMIQFATRRALAKPLIQALRNE